MSDLNSIYNHFVVKMSHLLQVLYTSTFWPYLSVIYLASNWLSCFLVPLLITNWRWNIFDKAFDISLSNSILSEPLLIVQSKYSHSGSFYGSTFLSLRNIWHTFRNLSGAKMDIDISRSCNFDSSFCKWSISDWYRFTFSLRVLLVSLSQIKNSI